MNASLQAQSGLRCAALGGAHGSAGRHRVSGPQPALPHVQQQRSSSTSFLAGARRFTSLRPVHVALSLLGGGRIMRIRLSSIHSALMQKHERRQTLPRRTAGGGALSSCAHSPPEVSGGGGEHLRPRQSRLQVVHQCSRCICVHTIEPSLRFSRIPGVCSAVPCTDA